MSRSLPPASDEPAAPVAESSAGAVFEPYENPAGGWGALRATALALREQSVVLKGSKALLSMNQPDGFDCPGCAWPDPKHTSSFEFGENGAKAVSFELTSRMRLSMLQRFDTRLQAVAAGATRIVAALAAALVAGPARLSG